MSNFVSNFIPNLFSRAMTSIIAPTASFSADVGGFGGGGGGGRSDPPPTVGDALDVTSPSTAADVNDNLYDDYLAYLQKGANIGLFATAQDVSDQAQLDREFQALEAQKERDWYEHLSGSAYQRQVADLEAAGLNPILGFAHGAGSGAPVASTAVPSGRSSNLSAMAPSLADYINAGANLLSSAADLLTYVTPKKTLSKILK